MATELAMNAEDFFLEPCLCYLENTKSMRRALVFRRINRSAPLGRDLKSLHAGRRSARGVSETLDADDGS
jgi:hypothetical protein